MYWEPSKENVTATTNNSRTLRLVTSSNSSLVMSSSKVSTSLSRSSSKTGASSNKVRLLVRVISLVRMIAMANSKIQAMPLGSKTATRRSTLNKVTARNSRLVSPATSRTSMVNSRAKVVFKEASTQAARWTTVTSNDSNPRGKSVTMGSFLPVSSCK
ncbi:hypothetical protein BCR43DRAFT_141196 [Syncephalastrum racemosum]|uniref:Uncharacterized protein n=1 Tax=Syncephalastrum racemosum TaxID=13706 RepID=A0A1X2HNH3_SYNRA|nr:hypothetical protein BCR43DRAFT_141196 [Syncephalastrum racemosum]